MWGWGERRGSEQRNGFRAGGGFPLDRLWLVVPFYWSGTSICTNRVGLNISSCELAFVQHSKRNCLWKSWVLPWLAGCLARKKKMQSGHVGTWRLSSILGFSERFTTNSKGSNVVEKDWEFLPVFQRNWCVHDEKNPLYGSRLRAHRQKKKVWAHLQSCWVEDCPSHDFESLSPTYFSS